MLEKVLIVDVFKSLFKKSPLGRGARRAGRVQAGESRLLTRTHPAYVHPSEEGNKCGIALRILFKKKVQRYGGKLF